MTLRLSVATEHRFLRGPSGRRYSQTGGREYRFWTRYLGVFDEVRILGRVRNSATEPDERSCAEGPGIGFAELPDYRGAVELSRRLRALRSAARRIAESPGAFLLRVPGPIGSLFARALRRAERSYGLEVVGDPAAVAESDAVPFLLRRLVRYWGHKDMASLCQGASAVAYVTRHALQRRYPPPSQSAAFHLPDVDLPPEAYVARARRFAAPALSLVAVGSLSQLYKGPDVLLHAVRALALDGLDLRVCWVGEGRHRRDLQGLVRTLDLEGRVSFVGQKPAGDAVRRLLDSADLFVLPSRTEGLPRALLEAMARGLPCVASHVGGIPELLDAEVLVPPGDPQALARTLRRVCTAPQLLERQALRNLELARGYSNDARAETLRRFLLRLRDAAGDSRQAMLARGEGAGLA